MDPWSRRRLVAYLVDMSGPAWRSLAVKMAWYVRKGGAGTARLPGPVKEIVGEHMTSRDWLNVRQVVVKKRNKSTRDRLRLRRANKLTRRRAYMCAYMKTYRTIQKS
jgi:hypothetical protein